MQRTLVLTSTICLGMALMAASPEAQPASPIIATRESTELLTTDFGTARILASGEQTNNAFTVIEGVVQPGYEVAVHQHAFAESFYVVEGTMTVQVGGETRLVPAGSYVFVPGGTPARLREPRQDAVAEYSDDQAFGARADVSPSRRRAPSRQPRATT